MKELEELTADIREKLPRLKELENGQKIIFLVADIPNSIYTGDTEIIGETASLLTNGDVDMGGYEYEPGKHFEIIGKEPMLNDVLEWYDERVTQNGVEGFYTRGFYDEFEDWIEWDLSKPYLKDQSPELIAFLHSLIKKTNEI